MASMWVESFKNISPDVFIDACRLHREGAIYFPVIKEILDRCSDVWAERRRNIKRLPEPIPDLSSEQIAENIKRLRSVVKGNRE